jgi:hypothetical protein
MSRDIPDGCRETSRTILGSSAGLVVLGGVDGEAAEELAVVGDDPDVEVGDEEQDAGAGVGATEADVEEFAAVAEGDAAGLVDPVSADAVVAHDGDGGCGGGGLGAGGEDLGGGAAGEGPVGSDGVVVGGEVVELGLQLGQGVGGGLFGQPSFEVVYLAAQAGIPTTVR